VVTVNVESASFSGFSSSRAVDEDGHEKHGEQTAADLPQLGRRLRRYLRSPPVCSRGKFE